jgi:predicted permease
MSRLRSLWRNLAHSDAVDADLEDELRAAFDLLVDEKIAAGMRPEEARRAATLELGRLESITTQVRQARGGSGLDALWQDATFGARQLRRSPLFAATAILSLAIGIGANATIFSLVDALLLRDLRFEDPGQLVELDRVTPRGQGSSFSYPAYEMLRDQNSVLSGAIAMSMTPIEATSDDAARPPAGRLVSGNFFDVLRARPLLGRTLTPADDAPGAAAAVITFGLWQREFGGIPDVLGRIVRVDSAQFTIVGVLPSTFDDLVPGRPADFFLPMSSEPRLRRESWLHRPDFSWLAIVGRLKPGVSLETAAAGLDPIFARVVEDLAATMPDEDGRRRIRSHRLAVASAANGLADLRRQFSKPVLLLAGAVALVLLIACANVVNLLLARGVARRREIALRLAIGASRSRLVRQLLTESALLGAAGGALGLLVAGAGAPLLVRLVSDGNAPIGLDVAPGATVLLFTAGTALVSSFLAGVLPAFRAVRADITPSFQGDTRSLSMTRTSARWGRALIVAQVALSVLLLVGAALLIATLRNIRRFDPGFERDHVLLLRLDPERAGYTDARIATYYRDVLSRIRAMRGVRAASLSIVTPISGGGIDLPFAVAGRPREAGVMVYANRTTEGFFATMGTPLLAGRDFVPQDGARRGTVVIVNRALAERYFKDDDPIGHRIRLRTDTGELEIVGVVANAKYLSLRESDLPTAYLYALDDPERVGLELSVRTSDDPLTFASDIRREVQSVAATVPISDVRTLSRQVERSLVRERLVARLLSAFAVLALVLASVGLYGVLGYAVARRTNEIGVRLALGAPRGTILRSVLRESWTVVAIGCAIGLPAAIFLSQLLASLLYGVTRSDPSVLTGVVASLFLVATMAAAAPAWRAFRVDPLVALRHE